MPLDSQEALIFSGMRAAKKDRHETGKTCAAKLKKLVYLVHRVREGPCSQDIHERSADTDPTSGICSSRFGVGQVGFPPGANSKPEVKLNRL